MPTYSYEKCLENSYKVNWRIEDVIGGREFDPDRRWLPSRLSGAHAPHQRATASAATPSPATSRGGVRSVERTSKDSQNVQFV